MTVSVVVADDQPLVRSGLVMLLLGGEDVQVLAEAGDGREAVEAARVLQPDLIVMDLRMPGTDGIEATRLLTADNAPDHLVKVLVVTTFDDDAAVYGALQAGASGFLLKQAAPRDLLSAVRTVAAGDAWIDPAVAGTVIAALAHHPLPDTRGARTLERLTRRETEVLALVAHGLSNTDIRARLFLSEATVKTHVSRILMKTGSRDRAQAVTLAYESGLVSPLRRRRPAY